jgi:hypothetical protein
LGDFGECSYLVSSSNCCDTPAFHLFRRGADGSWSPRERLELTPPEKARGYTQGFVTVADWNGDGEPDLLSRAGFNRGIVVAPGPFPEGGPVAVTHDIEFTPTSRGVTDALLWDFAVADWDRDGKPDLLVRQTLPEGRGGLFWYRNLGGDGMPKLAEGKLLLGLESLGVNRDRVQVPGFCVGDWSGDGWPDLILTRDELTSGVWGGTVLVYLRE